MAEQTLNRCTRCNFIAIQPFINAKGNWQVGGQDLKVKAKGSNGTDGITPELQVTETGMLQVSVDSGKTWTDLYQLPVLPQPYVFQANLVNSPGAGLAIGQLIPLDTVVIDTTNGGITMDGTGIITLTENGIYQIIDNEVNSWISGYITNLVVNDVIYATNVPTTLLQVDNAPVTVNMTSGSIFTLAATSPQASMAIIKIG